MSNNALECLAEGRQRAVSQPQRDGFNGLIFMPNVLNRQPHSQLAEIFCRSGSRRGQKPFGEHGAGRARFFCQIRDAPVQAWLLVHGVNGTAQARVAQNLHPAGGFTAAAFNPAAHD